MSCKTCDYCDLTVFPSSDVACDFPSGSLCAYRQGCADPEMAHWTSYNGYAEVKQENAGCGSNTFSVLESPWLNFTTTSCVTVNFSRKIPTNLDVFFVVWGASPVTVLNRAQHSYLYIFQGTIVITVHKLIGKILFRAYGGGGSSHSFARVHYVSVCHRACHQPDKTILGPPTTTANPTTTTRTTTATTPPTTSAVATATSPTSPTTVYPGSFGSEAGIVSHEDFTSQEWLPFESTSLGDLETKSGSAHPHEDITNAGADTSVIAGASVAACIVVFAALVAVVVWRRLRSCRNRGEKDNHLQSAELSSLEKGHVPDSGKTGGTLKDYSTVVDARILQPSSSKTDYYDVNGIKETDEDPYEVIAEDGTSGRRLDVDSDPYNHINQKPTKSGVNVGDDSNHIAKPLKLVCHLNQNSLRSGGTTHDEYSRVNHRNTDRHKHKPLKSEGIGGDDYNHISQTRQCEAIGDDDYSYISQTRNCEAIGDDDYSHISQTRRCEAIGDDDYNHISQTRQCEAIGDEDYNHISQTRNCEAIGDDDYNHISQTTKCEAIGDDDYNHIS